MYSNQCHLILYYVRTLIEYNYKYWCIHTYVCCICQMEQLWIAMRTVHAYVNVFMFVAYNMQLVHLLAHVQHAYIVLIKICAN